MDDKGRHLGDRRSSGQGLQPGAPTRQSLLKRIRNSLRPSRPNSTSSSQSLQDWNPDGRGKTTTSYNPHHSNPGYPVSRPGSDGFTQSSHHVEEPPGHRRILNSVSKTASLDRVLTRVDTKSRAAAAAAAAAAASADIDVPFRKLSRSQSVRLRTAKMLDTFRRVGHNKTRGTTKSRDDHHEENIPGDDADGEESQKKYVQARNEGNHPDSRNICNAVARDGKSTNIVVNPNVDIEANGIDEDSTVSSLQDSSVVSKLDTIPGSGSPYQQRSQGMPGSSGIVAGLFPKKWRSRPKLPGTNGELFLWSPAKGEYVNYEWESLSGRSLTLVDCDVNTLSEPERYMLQKVALDELAQFNLHSHIVIPKEDGQQAPSSLKRGLSFRNRPKASSSALSDVDGKGSARSCSHFVFKIPLSQVIYNDIYMRKQLLSASTPLSDRSKVGSMLSGGLDSREQSAANSCESLNEILEGSARSPESMEFLPHPLPQDTDAMIGKPPAIRTASLPVGKAGNAHAYNPVAPFANNPGILESAAETSDTTPVRTSSMSVTSPGRGNNAPPFLGKRVRTHGQVTPSPDVGGDSMQAHLHTPLSSVMDSGGRSFSVDRLLEALVLDTSSPSPAKKRGGRKQEKFPMAIESLCPVPPKVPVIVSSSVDFLTQHGLNQEGLFRVEGSKRRCRQIQEEFDTGFEISFSENDHYVHDVAYVLKNFFRSLPEPLLTRTLYQSFLSITKFDSQERQIHVLRLLCFLLPAANRDTLRVLLEFLYLVSTHAEDSFADDGTKIPGNKMDSYNLAVVMGPNILRPHKAKSGYASRQQKEQKLNSKGNYVVQLLIQHHKLIFQVTKQLHHRVLLLLQVQQPHLVDYLLKKKCVDLGLDIPKIQLLELTADKSLAAESPKPSSATGAADDEEDRQAHGHEENAFGSNYNLLKEKIPHLLAGYCESSDTSSRDVNEDTNSNTPDTPEAAGNTFPSTPMSSLHPEALLGSTKVRSPSTSSPRRALPRVRRSRSARVQHPLPADAHLATPTAGAHLRRNTSLGGHDRGRVQPALPRSSSDAMVSPAPTVTTTTPAVMSPAMSSGEVTPTLQTTSAQDVSMIAIETSRKPDSAHSSPSTGKAVAPEVDEICSSSMSSLSSESSTSEDLSCTLKDVANADDIRTPTAAVRSPGLSKSTSLTNTPTSPRMLSKSSRLSNNTSVRTSDNGRVYRLLCYFEALADEKKIHEQQEEEARQKRHLSPIASRRASQISAAVNNARQPKRMSLADGVMRRSSSSSVSAIRKPVMLPSTVSASAPSSANQSRSTSFSTHPQEEKKAQVSPVASNGSVMTTDSGCSACTSGASLDSNTADTAMSPLQIEVKPLDQFDLRIGKELSPSLTSAGDQVHNASESGIELSGHSSTVDMTKSAGVDGMLLLSPEEAAHDELCGVRCHSRASHIGLRYASVGDGNDETDV